ncbi:hypothetical protein CcaverHIS641_0601920 [Cutaneotrichosporon cavernicola]|nr:hypothetical protein CcaverHIS641_0601920 [Cutaneotrichosporon cavernicola]
MLSPLDNVQQLLYAPDGTRYLVLSRTRAYDVWEMTMWTSEGLGGAIPRVWSGQGDVGALRDEGRTRDIADAILAGMLSVQVMGSGGLRLLIHVLSAPFTVFLGPVDPGQPGCVTNLLSAAFSMKEAKPATADENSTRAHQAQIDALQAEITSLQSRNANLKAQIQRQTGSSGRKDADSQACGATQERERAATHSARKVVEDEFMGSSDEDEDDDDDDSEEYSEGD